MIETHTDTHTYPRTEKAFPFSFDTSELAAPGKKRLQVFVNAHSELLDEIH
jgi:hypothetical protein